VKKNKKIIYKNFIQKRYLNSKYNSSINRKYSNILKSLIINLDNTKDTFHLLSDKFRLNFQTKELKKFKKFKTVIVVGMGGSILGSEAIYSFLEKKIRKFFLFIDDINASQLIAIKKKHNLNKTLFIIISKSGSTIETLSNISALKIIKKNSNNVIIISEKRNNPLYLISQKMKLYYIEHRNYIGGRYSVLSEVGMVPAYLMGINILNIRKNLLNHLNYKNQIFLKDSVKKIANLLKNKIVKNLIFFNYIPQLNKFLYWNQQLIAESLGKEGKGFLPIISPAPKDHHSLLQLYLDGPKDKLFYIFSADLDDNKRINSKMFGNKLNYLNNKSLSQIKLAQKNAFLSILKKKKIPFREFRIRDLSEEVLGELFSYFILETAIVGQIININPFDQPAVEQVKIKTKKLLV
jgi:glucose-6-phosphate isomerase